MDIQITRRNLFILLSILVVLIAIPLTLYLSQKSQETRSHASQDDPVVATVAGKQIHQSDLSKGDLAGYDSATAKDTAVERAILDSIASDEGISADQSEIDQVASEEGVSAAEAKYEILRNKITLEKVRYVKALAIGYWEPIASDQGSYSSDDKTTIEKQVTDGGKALTEAASSLATSDDVATVTSDLIKKYPSLNDVLAMNGLIFSQIDDSDKADSATPAIYQYGDSNFDPETKDAVFSTSNQVDSIVNIPATSTSGGGTVLKIKEIGKGTEDSYDSWLAKEKNSLVK